MIDRKAFTPFDIVKEIWTHLDLPPAALSSLSLPGADGADGADGASRQQQIRPVVRSSFKIGHLAQSTIALSALGAATAHSALSSIHDSGSASSSISISISIPRVTVPLRHATLEFHCERLYTLAGKPPAESWGPIGGVHPTADGGHVRIHDVFPHHREGALALLGLPLSCTDRAAVSARTRKWKAVELETVAVEEGGLAIYALRSFAEWDALPQARAQDDIPVTIRTIEIPPYPSSSSSSSSPPSSAPSPSPPPPHSGGDEPAKRNSKRSLSGIRVLELSRVIAAPVAGKTLAAHGADVLWVTSPNLPDLPGLDREFARGKRSARLDLERGADRAALLELAGGADVVIQGYRPGSLAARGLDPVVLALARARGGGRGEGKKGNRGRGGVVVANLAAFGPGGPWEGRRGFDSLVQTCSGLNIAEAEAFGAGVVEGAHARALPCQALDHAAGYLLAAGVCAALYKRERDMEDGRRVGAYVVDVSLAGVAGYLRSLGQFEGRDGFEEGEDLVAASGLWGGGNGEKKKEEKKDELFETRETAFGEMTFLRHSARIEGFEPAWDVMPRPLGSDEAVWKS
ncbi:CoA-transferase family III [Nemania serpens]|nr:CoA-transferase family III [Nemania serpens]